MQDIIATTEDATRKAQADTLLQALDGGWVGAGRKVLGEVAGAITGRLRRR